MKLLFALSLLAVVCVFTLACSVTSDDTPPVAADSAPAADQMPLTAVDINGRSWVLGQRGARGVLLVFVLHNCPIANAYAPKIERIYRTYTDRGIDCFVVQADPNVSDDLLRLHAEEYGLSLPVLHDRTHALVRRTGATVAPQAVLFDPQWQIVYSGRIDDQYVDFGTRRRQPTSDDLVRALDELLAGKQVAPRETQPVGCYLADLFAVPPAREEKEDR
jgi:hypothetical protein